MNESSDDEAARLEQVGFYTSALPNQVTAILNAGDRTERVAQITAPTLVRHGANDKLLTVEHGRHSAETIVGARFKVYENMGHNLPDDIVPVMVRDMSRAQPPDQRRQSAAVRVTTVVGCPLEPPNLDSRYCLAAFIIAAESSKG